MKTTPAPDARRLIATVAWLYHTRGLRQSAIAERLNISQSRVSRLLEQAIDLDIVRTSVVLPSDEQSILENELESAYGLKQATVYAVGARTDGWQLRRELGELMAEQLQTMPLDSEVIGFTSWSRTLQEMVAHLRPLRNSVAKYVVEMLGDLGPPSLQHLAAENTRQFATLAGAEPIFLRLPGVLPSAAVKQTLLAHDSHAREALQKLDLVDFALVGIGSGEIVPPLRAGDNFFTDEQVAQAKAGGAVGEVNLHFIAEDGGLVHTGFEDQVVGVSVEQLRRVGPRLGVAGGPSKYQAIRAALLGGWVNMVVTDSITAQWLLDHRES